MMLKNCRLVATMLSLLLLLSFTGGSVVAFNRIVELGSSFQIWPFQIVSPIYAGDYGARPGSWAAPLDPFKMFCEHNISKALIDYSVGKKTSEVERFFGKPGAIDGQVMLPGWPAVCGSADQNWLYRVGVSSVVVSFRHGECIGASKIDYMSDFRWQDYKAQQLMSKIPGLRREEVKQLLGGIREIEIHPESGARTVNFSIDEADEITSFEIGYGTLLTVGWRQNRCLGGDVEHIVH